MKHFYFLFGIILFSCQSTNLPRKSSEFILVRHAETIGKGATKVLNERGLDRAIDLSKLIESQNVTTIYSTDYPRTKQTAAASAKLKSLEVVIYDPRNLEEFATMLKTKHKNEIVLVVGHSNTTPALANALIERKEYEQFDETIYDQIIRVTVGEEANSHELQKYGQKSPRTKDE